jgi:hypothetical protein
VQARIVHYEKIYQTVREEEGAYIKLFNLRAKAHACNVYGRMTKVSAPTTRTLTHAASTAPWPR